MNRTQSIELQHPLYEVPSIATQQGCYRQDGEAIGLRLLFCDGHTANLTYDEIDTLKRAVRPPAEAGTAATRSHITIDRRAFDYTMSLVRAGVEVVTDHRIKRDRAMEIVNEHDKDGPDFDPERPLTWTWSVEVLNEAV